MVARRAMTMVLLHALLYLICVHRNERCRHYHIFTYFFMYNYFSNKDNYPCTLLLLGSKTKPYIQGTYCCQRWMLLFQQRQLSLYSCWVQKLNRTYRERTVAIDGCWLRIPKLSTHAKDWSISRPTLVKYFAQGTRCIVALQRVLSWRSAIYVLL